MGVLYENMELRNARSLPLCNLSLYVYFSVGRYKLKYSFGLCHIEFKFGKPNAPPLLNLSSRL